MTLADHFLAPLPNICLFASTTCRQCLQLAGRVYLCRTVSADHTHVHSVYKTMHGVYMYTQCQQTVRIRTRIRASVASTSCIRTRVSMYTRVYAYKYIFAKSPPPNTPSAPMAEGLPPQ